MSTVPQVNSDVVRSPNKASPESVPEPLITSAVDAIKESVGIQRREKFGNSIVRFIPRATAAMAIDVGTLLFGAGLLGVAAIFKPSLDPSIPKPGIVPILLVHGSGYNDMEWIVGRQFLKNEKYGSVYSLNYDGLASNDPKMGIDDYAAGKVRDKILEIKEKTGQNRIILVGHSMGGCIALQYRIKHANQDGITVDGVITIASPLTEEGSPLLREKSTQSKRYNQMSKGSSFLKGLSAEARQLEFAGLLKMFNLGGAMDPMVPGPNSIITKYPERARIFSYLSHYGMIVAPAVWYQIQKYMDELYEVRQT